MAKNNESKQQESNNIQTTSSPGHCPYSQASLLQQALTPDKMRVAFLIGAGCPAAIRIKNEQGEQPLIPDVDGLTNKVHEAIQSSDSHKDNYGIILRRLKDSGTRNQSRRPHFGSSNA